jgi:hypothetical protein
MVLNAFLPELVRQRTGGDVAGSRQQQQPDQWQPDRTDQYLGPAPVSSTLSAGYRGHVHPSADVMRTGGTRRA